MVKILKKMNVLLDGRQKRAMAALIIMMLIGGVLESLGVSMLVPIVTVVMDPEAVGKANFSPRFTRCLGWRTALSLLCFCCFLLWE